MRYELVKSKFSVYPGAAYGEAIISRFFLGMYDYIAVDELMRMKSILILPHHLHVRMPHVISGMVGSGEHQACFVCLVRY
jgi:hypothetical protein